MSLYTLLSRKPEGATAVDIEQGLAGNLCRCTGYRTILNAAKAFSCDGDGLGNTVKGLCGAGAAQLIATAPATDPGHLDGDGGWHTPSGLEALCVAKVSSSANLRLVASRFTALH
jgi:xanthine dehydrogenase iron-sulfur cluster and FAD-binding subunit A